MTPRLPQDDPNATARAQAIAEAREALPYDYDRYQGIAFATPVSAPGGVPQADPPDPSWLEHIVANLLRLGANAEKVTGKLNRMHPAHPEHGEALRLIRDVEKGGFKAALGEIQRFVTLGEDPWRRADSLEDFTALFQTIPVPPAASVIDDDLAFARYQVAGPNPMVLARLDRIPDKLALTAADVDAALATLASRGIDVTGGALHAALDDGRVFVADYAPLAGLTAGAFEGAPKVIGAPIAVFVAAGVDRRLLPVAIQAGQAATDPLVRPGDGDAWWMGRLAVQMANGNHHEAVAHLGRTHLVMEAVWMAARRNLAPNHPLRVLLEPHFEGTRFINDASETTLTAPGGGVDVILTPTIADSRRTAEAAVATWSFTGAMLDNDLRARGLDDRTRLPDHPYRDDGALVWAAIADWVESFVRVYYADDAAVRADRELRAMFTELGAHDGGRLRDVPLPLHIPGLITAITHLIFTPSAQHAAVNFPQAPWMSFAPTMPLATFAWPRGRTATRADVLAMLPPLGVAHFQMGILELLSSVHHTRLGAYEGGWFSNFAHDPAVNPGLKAFQARLAQVEGLIEARNRARPTPYPFLRPSLIPQSINI